MQKGFIYTVKSGPFQKVLLIALLLITCSSAVFGQQQQVPLQPGSLPPAFYSAKNDFEKISFLKKTINDSINENNLQQVSEWSRVALNLIEHSGPESLKGYFFLYIGKFHYYHSINYDSAIYFYKKALPYFPDPLNYNHIMLIKDIMENFSDKGNKDSTLHYLGLVATIMDALPDTAKKKISLAQNIATVYTDMGLFKTAIRYYTFAINGCMKNKNYRGLGLALANLAWLYDEMEDYDNALHYAKEALSYLGDVKGPWVQTASNVGNYYYHLTRFDSAAAYLQRSDEVARQLNDSFTLNLNENVRAGINIKEKRFAAAGKKLSATLSFFETHDDPVNVIKTLLLLSNLDTAQHNYKSAEEKLAKTLDISDKNGSLSLQIIALQNLADVETLLGNYQSALTYHRKYTDARDSLSKQKTKTDLAEFEISYKTQQKEQQIVLLKKDNDIQTLELRNIRNSLYFYIALFLLCMGMLAIIFYQRNWRNKIQHQKLKAKLQTQVLRSQMNPHFIFNSLNSIENFIMQNDKRQASDYLNKFSRLIRSILESSNNEVVPIGRDMEALRLYIELEQLRFNNKFSYHENIESQLLLGDYLVPSLLIQPYVENAIVHGIAHSHEEQLQLTVTATLESDIIRYTIQDNGVGRGKAAEYNSQNKPAHKSVGLQITADRIALFNLETQSNASVQITDLYNDNNEPAGTRVDIQLKAI
jgi:tetratricopeptide (TPR) repeat protein